MKVDKFGVSHRTSNELCDLIYSDPELNLHSVQIDDPEDFNRSIKELFTFDKSLQKYRLQDESIETFDVRNQSDWYMPDEYKKLDIAKWVLDQCKTDEELQRVGEELLLFQDRNLIDLLRFMKYFVDQMREHNIVWGVGRGSSVASYVLFLLQVHRIDSLYYGLDINEFLK